MKRNFKLNYDRYLETLKAHEMYGYEVGFVKVLDLFPPAYLDENAETGNLFLANNGWDKFKQSIVDNGTFWAFHVAKYEYSIPKNYYFESDKWHIIEGFHRYKAILELIEEEKLPKDFKIFCIKRKIHPQRERGSAFISELQTYCSNCYGNIDFKEIQPAAEINTPGMKWGDLEL